LVTKADIDQIGYIRDKQNRITNARTYDRFWIVKARDFIYRLGFGVASASVEKVLKAKSLVPTLVGLLSDGCDSR
jgi:hypothetical protein